MYTYSGNVLLANIQNARNIFDFLLSLYFLNSNFLQDLFDNSSTCISSDRFILKKFHFIYYNNITPRKHFAK